MSDEGPNTLRAIGNNLAVDLFLNTKATLRACANLWEAQDLALKNLQKAWGLPLAGAPVPTPSQLAAHGRYLAIERAHWMKQAIDLSDQVVALVEELRLIRREPVTKAPWTVRAHSVWNQVWEWQLLNVNAANEYAKRIITEGLFIVEDGVRTFYPVHCITKVTITPIQKEIDP